MEHKLSEYLDRIVSLGFKTSTSNLGKAISGPSWAKSKEGQELVEYLSKTDIYSIFDEHLQFIGNTGISVTLIQLADWLVERATAVGGQEAQEDFTAYIQSDHYEAYAVMLLAEVGADSEFEFCNGAKLTGPGATGNRLLDQSFFINMYMPSLPLPKASSLLAASFQHAKLHTSNQASDENHPKVDIPYRLLEDVKTCLILARPIGYGVQSIANSVIATDNIPVIHSISGWSLHSFKMPPMAPPITTFEMQKADEILKCFCMLNNSVRTKTIKQVERLNGYSSGASMVDRAIDLRVCLESIFLDDGKSDSITHKLAIRVALFLGDNLEMREAIFKKVKDAYNVTSAAIHSGEMPNKNVELLPEVAELARKAILKIIELGEVKWKHVELQSS